MAYILSSNTIVIFGYNPNTQATGILSVSVNAVPQRQALYRIGYTDPYNEIRRLQTTINITRIGGGPIYPVPETIECEDANSIYFSITPETCTDVGSDISDPVKGYFFVSSFSFSKEVFKYGQESWGLVDKPITTYQFGPTVGGDSIKMIRGTSQGSTTTGNNTGVILSATGQGEGSTINLNAGNPGVGRANKLTTGIVTRVGGSNSFDDETDGQAQASIPYTPLQLPEVP